MEMEKLVLVRSSCSLTSLKHFLHELEGDHNKGMSLKELIIIIFKLLYLKRNFKCSHQFNWWVWKK